MKTMSRNKLEILAIGIMIFWPLSRPVRGEVEVDVADPEFSRYVEAELTHLREGDRGLACQVLVDRLDKAQAVTQIKPLTRDDSTWHPNDRKGVRSHVVPQDVEVRGAARSSPTDAILFLHPSRINPKLSSFKLGTFVHELSDALDLNRGTFSGDYRVRERRATFYQNAWRDSLGVPLLELSGGVPTTDYQWAKEMDLLTDENKELFPILRPEEEDKKEGGEEEGETNVP